MKWWPALPIAAACLAGCSQTPRGPSDPFLRTTVPPPQTGQFAPPPAGAYYTPGVAGAPVGAPMTPGVAPIGVGAPAQAYGGVPAAAAPAYGSVPPANYGGAPPASYGAPPANYAPPAGMPGSAPATAPASTPNDRYMPPGSGFNFQSSLDRAKAVTPVAGAGKSAGPTLARSSSARSRLVHVPQTDNPASAAEPSSDSDVGAASTASAQTAATPAIAIVPPLTSSAVQQASYVEPAGTADAAADAASDSMPATESRLGLVASDSSAGDSSSGEPADSGNSSGGDGSSGNGSADANVAQASVGVSSTEDASAESPAATSSGAATASPSAIASAGVPEITDLPAATGSDTLRAYGASRSRLVFTRANRPMTSPIPASVVDASPAAPTVGKSHANYAVADDYGILYGKLEYSQAQRQWKLRYIPIDGKTDNYGGSVLLPDADAVKNFHPGDFVVVHGQVGGAGSQRGFSPEYEVRQIAVQ